MGIKYYYSAPLQLRKLTVLADADGAVVYTFDKSEYIKTLPRVVVCSILSDDVLSFGYAVCSSKDTYNKKLGQIIAFNRARQKPYAIQKIEDMSKIHEISDEIVQSIFDKETARIYG